MTKGALIRKPNHQTNEIAYDADCKDAMAAHLDRLLDEAVDAGWDRSKVASALMYLSARRLNLGPRNQRTRPPKSLTTYRL